MNSRDKHVDGDQHDELRSSNDRFLLRPADQVTLFFILSICAIGICGYVAFLGFGTSGLESFDEIERQNAEFQVDINTAPWTEIALLPNIGETIARAIVKFREANGGIENIESLVQIDGISDKKLAQLRRYTIPLQPNAELLVGKNRP